MFTGIVAGVGEVTKTDHGPDLRLWITSPLLDGCELGASVAVNGVCLTVAGLDSGGCRFEVSAETMVRTTLGDLSPPGLVNLERPLRVGDELGGHIVQGHVDGVGTVEEVWEEGEGRRLRVGLPPGLARYVVEKGSVTVDGVSLTVTAVSDEFFEVALVPHTLKSSTLGGLARGRRVNIEVDVLGRFVERMLSLRGPGQAPPHESEEED